MKRTRSFLPLLAVLAIMMVVVAAGTGSPAYAAANQCRLHVSVERWNNQSQIEAQGFNFFVEDSGSSTFAGEYLRLGIAPDLDGDYSSGRIHEVDTAAPVDERVKCWQPSETRRIEAEYRIRWGTDGVNPSLTESAYLVNAAAIDFNPQAKFTAVGVVRTPVLGSYGAVVAQDVYATPQGQLEGFLSLRPLFEIDPTEWHTVRLTVWEQRAKIEIEQDGTTVIVDEQVPAPFEAMGTEFTIDNELLPGLFAPIVTGDTLDVDFYRISAVRN